MNIMRTLKMISTDGYSKRVTAFYLIELKKHFFKIPLHNVVDLFLWDKLHVIIGGGKGH